MRISDWSSDVCSSDLRTCDAQCAEHSLGTGVAQRRAVVSGHVAYQPGHVAGQRLLRPDLVAQLELLTYSLELESRLPAEQANAEALEHVHVLVYIQVTQSRHLLFSEHHLVWHIFLFGDSFSKDVH